MAKPTKPSALLRTIDLFAEPAPVVEERSEIEGERLPIEQDVDRMRDNAFKGQEWTSKYFARLDAPGSEYRVSHKGDYYYVESVMKTQGGATAYGYTGIMVHASDLLNLTQVLVQAVRDKQAKDKT